MRTTVSRSKPSLTSWPLWTDLTWSALRTDGPSRSRIAGAALRTGRAHDLLLFARGGVNDADLRSVVGADLVRVAERARL